MKHFLFLVLFLSHQAFAGQILGPDGYYVKWWPGDQTPEACIAEGIADTQQAIADYPAYSVPHDYGKVGVYLTVKQEGPETKRYDYGIGVQFPILPGQKPGENGLLVIKSCYYITQRAVVSSNQNPLDPRECISPKATGSLIDFQKRTVVESIPIEGTGFSLNYSSEFNFELNMNRTVSNSYSIFYPFDNSLRIEYATPVSGVVLSSTDYASSPAVASKLTLSASSTLWNIGTFSSKATVIANFYETGMTEGNCWYIEHPNPPYASTYTYECASGISMQLNDSTSMTAMIYRPEVFGMHGWTLSGHHYFDRTSKILFSGDGEKIQYNGYQTVTDATLGTVDVVISKSDENQMFIFDSSGKHLETRHVFLGYIINKFAYDGSNRLTSITDRFNKSSTLTYSGSNLQKITSPYGVETSFTISSNRISKATDPEGFEYNMTYNSSNGLLLTFEPPNGVVTTFSYNTDGELTQESKSNGLLQSFTKSLIDGVLELTKSLNFGLDRSLKFVKTNSTEQINELDSNGMLIYQQEKSFYDNVTSFKFNQDIVTQNFSPSSEWGSDRVIVNQSVRSVTESGQSVSDTTQYSETRTYTSGNVLKPVNYSNSYSYNFGNAGTISNAYTKSNTTLLSTDLFGVQTAVKFSASGVVTRISSIDKYPVDFEYDTLGRLTKIKKTSSYYETYGYDTYGYLSTINNSKSQLTQFVRNKKGQLLQKILPNSESIYFEYTDGGEIKKITAPNNQVHNFQLSLGDYITQMISPSSKTTTYDYDSDKRLSLVTKPSGKTLSYEYETNRNALKRIVTSSGTVTIGGRDIRSRITSMTSIDNIETDIAWASDQVQSQSWYDNGTLVATLSNNFATDQFKVAEIYLNSNLIASYSYSNGILSGISNLGISYSHSFNTYDHTQTVAGSGFSVTYSGLDSSSQPTQVITGTVIDSSSNPLTVNMRRTYDNFGQATTVISTKLNQNTGLYTGFYTLTPVYDSNNRLTQVTRAKKYYVGSTLTNLTEFVNKYTFPSNSNNNVSNTRQNSGTTTVAVKSTSSTYNIDDQLTQITGTVSRTYTYTSDGEVNTMTSASGTTSYQYDSFGYLKKATLPGGTVVEYKTDAMNRRFKKLVNGVTQEYYLWYDQTRLAAILDSSKSPKLTYIYGSETENTPGFVVKNGITYKIIHDPGTESVRYIIDITDGSLAQEIDYDEFGNITLNTNPSFQPLGYAGGLYDSDTKLVKFGARDYDPVIGRWLTKDPINFAGGDTNLYAYVEGNPMSLVDPDGLAPEKKMKDPAGSGAGGGGSCPIPQDTVFVAPNGQAAMGYKGGTFGPSNNGGGLKITNGNTEIRLMGPNNFYNNGYGRINNGQYLDTLGNAVPKNDPAGHILPPGPWKGN